MKYVSAKEFKEHFKITGTTLKRWRESDYVKYKIISSHKVLYDIDSIKERSNNIRKNVIYARVESDEQSNELTKQIELIKSYMISIGKTVDSVYYDFDTSLDDNRSGFNDLLNSLFLNEIDSIYIYSKEKLIRFNYEMLKNIFLSFGTNIITIDNTDILTKDDTQELRNDIIKILKKYKTSDLKFNNALRNAISLFSTLDK